MKTENKGEGPFDPRCGDDDLVPPNTGGPGPPLDGGKGAPLGELKNKGETGPPLIKGSPRGLWGVAPFLPGPTTRFFFGGGGVRWGFFPRPLGKKLGPSS